MITRNDPKPGEFLFIGGCADGERREIAQPYETIRVIERTLSDDSVFIEKENRPNTAPHNLHVYRLSKLFGEKLTFFVYLHEQMDGDDLMKALMRRYTGAKP